MEFDKEELQRRAIRNITDYAIHNYNRYIRHDLMLKKAYDEFLHLIIKENNAESPTPWPETLEEISSEIKTYFAEENQEAVVNPINLNRSNYLQYVDVRFGPFSIFVTHESKYSGNGIYYYERWTEVNMPLKSLVKIFINFTSWIEGIDDKVRDLERQIIQMQAAQEIIKETVTTALEGYHHSINRTDNGLEIEIYDDNHKGTFCLNCDNYPTEFPKVLEFIKNLGKAIEMVKS